MLWVGILIGCLSIAVGYWYWKNGDPRWQTILFSTLTLTQIAHVLANRSERLLLFRMGLLSNKPLLAAVSLTVILQLALIYIPALRTVFHTVSRRDPILPSHWPSRLCSSALSHWNSAVPIGPRSVSIKSDRSDRRCPCDAGHVRR